MCLLSFGFWLPIQPQYLRFRFQRGLRLEIRFQNCLLIENDRKYDILNAEAVGE